MKILAFALVVPTLVWASASKKPAVDTAPKTQPPFAEYLFNFVQQHELVLPIANNQSSTEDPAVYIKTAEAKKRIEFYRAALPAKVNGLHWQIEELAPEFALPTVHPVPKFTNNALFWALDGAGKKVFAFRPVDTTTGCDTGCTPVVFHLVLNAEGKTVRILEEKKRPLRKSYHQVLTAEDKKKLLELTQKLPQGLQTVTQPKSLVNWEEQFPPQTWTFFSSFVVKEGAFTSYRVFEAALTSLRAIQATPAERGNTRYKVEEAMGQYFRVSDATQAQKTFDQGMAELSNEKSPAEIQGLHALLLPYLLTWMNLGGTDVLAPAKKLFSLATFSTSHLDDLCTFEKNLMASPTGRKAWVSFDKDFSKRPSCGDKLEKFLRIYSNAIDNPSKVHTSDFASFDINSLPNFVHDRPEMLVNIVKVLPEKSALRAKSLALVDAYYPKAFDLPAAAGLAAERQQITAEVRAEVHQNRVLEVERKFLAESMKIPPLPLIDRNGKDLGNKQLSTLPETKVVIFFASWCPHCRATVSKMVSSHLDDKTWDRIQLVEIFAREAGNLDEFCKVTQLPKERCDKVFRLKPESKEVDAFLEGLGIHSVPRIALIGPQGELLVSNLDLNINEYADADRELNLTFEAARTFKKIAP